MNVILGGDRDDLRHRDRTGLHDQPKDLGLPRSPGLLGQRLAVCEHVTSVVVVLGGQPASALLGGP